MEKTPKAGHGRPSEGSISVREEATKSGGRVVGGEVGVGWGRRAAGSASGGEKAGVPFEGAGEQERSAMDGTLGVAVRKGLVRRIQAVCGAAFQL